MIKMTTLFALVGTLVLATAVQAQPAAPKPPAPSAPASSVQRSNAVGTQMRQVQSVCKKKVSDAGLTGEAGKKAMFDCMRNPS
jgi:hypothetical protein